MAYGAVFVVLAVVRLVIIRSWASICADVGQALNAGYEWRLGNWFYRAEGMTCPCTPLRPMLMPAALWIAEQLMEPFGWGREVAFAWTHRLFCVVADLVIAVGLARLGVAARTLLWAVALNPYWLLLTGIHGNMIAVSLAPVVVAVAWRRYWVLSALALGVGIGFGEYPLLLAPLIAWMEEQ